MKANDIRTKFLEYFEKNGHKKIPSSSLIPKDDSTLLFTNAGMVQFKQYFLGIDNPSYTRVASSQCCIRAGGKHNDLENVGYTKRHHTFFEMLGNFSFGDYFKKDAIKYAWEFITRELKIPENKLWITVYKDDQETSDIWLNDIGIDPKRLSYCGEKDNFWSMGLTGPCGPCTEIFYDHGESVPGGPPGSADEDGDRYVEIWNIVFMEFERLEDGELKSLPMKSVDTGMGLERVSAVMQGVNDNYEIDLFRSLIQEFKKKLQVKIDNPVALKVIADHIRSIVFLIAEGVLPSNDGRGYVLRRIIRRAIRYGTKLGLEGEFVYKLVGALVSEMGEHYPTIIEKQKFIEKTIAVEEKQFGKTLYTGLKILEKDIASLKDNLIPGDLIFKMYDTYGFPLDLLQDIAKEKKLDLDLSGYEQNMENQRNLARNSSNFQERQKSIEISDQISSEFTGYKNTKEQSKIISLLQDEQEVDEVENGSNELIGMILDKTPFYAESGGQIGDAGVIKGDNFRFEVTDTQKIKDAIIHYGKLVEGNINIDDIGYAEIDKDRRLSIKNNHTATHLLHAALKEILGTHAEQKGSIVTADKLRFDFMHNTPLTPEQIIEVEELVNHYIRANIQVSTDVQSYNDAVDSGAVALFGEKYQDSVRVVSVADFSKELCGGTHVTRTGDIGIFKIISEYSIATGVRRIDAFTGIKALNNFQLSFNRLSQLANMLNVSEDELLVKAKQLLDDNKKYRKNIDRQRTGDVLAKYKDLSGEKIKDQNGKKVMVLVKDVDDVDSRSLKNLVDDLLNVHTQLGNEAVILLAAKIDKKLNVVCKISDGLVRKDFSKLSKKELPLSKSEIPSPTDLVKEICGKGGGRDNMAQGGSSIPHDLDDRLEKVKKFIMDSIQGSAESQMNVPRNM
ncbi:MAG: alanine--tRNA ligase [Legionellales bacterium]|nr:alanine--tRNA ligase [Legionellales bacterium]